LLKSRDPKEIYQKIFSVGQVILSISPTLSTTLSEDLFYWASDLVSSSSMFSLIHFNL